MAQVVVDRGFSEASREEIAALYWAAFSDKLGAVLGPRERALDLLRQAMAPSHAVTAFQRSHEGQGERVIGVAGFKTADGSFVGGDVELLRAVYGSLGALWRVPMLALLDRRTRPGALTMDGIAVAPEARGQGVGTRLLRAVCEEARHRGLDTVRLDVVDTNPRARALYERFGFRASKDVELGPLRHVFGFGRATTMHLSVPRSP